MTYRSYDDWRRQGYTVIYGQKSSKKIEGVAMFSEEQVKRYSPRYRKPKHDGFYEQYRRCSCRR